jgi:hypothetical protein
MMNYLRLSRIHQMAQPDPPDEAINPEPPPAPADEAEDEPPYPGETPIMDELSEMKTYQTSTISFR